MLFFLEGEAEARRAVIERRAAHPEPWLVEQNVVYRQFLLMFAPERRPATEAGAPRHAGGVNLGRFEREIGIVALDQVPGVRPELACHLSQESGRAVKPHHVLAAETDSEQPVEADEVVHMRVRHEHVAQAQDLARCQRPQIAQVEHQGAFFKQKVDIQARVPERTICQHRVKDWFHVRYD